MTTTHEVNSLLRGLQRVAHLPERNRERQEWLARKAAILERIEHLTTRVRLP